MEWQDILQELVITSGLEMVEGAISQDSWQLADIPHMGVVVQAAKGQKCPRCWTIHQDDTTPHVNYDSDVPLCARCDKVIGKGNSA